MAPISRRLALAAMAGVAFIPFAHAQETWPSKRVSILIGSAAGGLQDLQGRLLADGLHKLFPDQAFTPVNIPGSGSIASAEKLATSPADGTTLLIASSAPMGLAAATRGDLTYDYLKDFIPVTQFTANFLWVMVNPKKIAVTSVPELIQALKATPDKYNYASSGVGSQSHVQTELFMLRTGTRITHIPYKSTREMTTALLNGDVDMQVSAVDATDEWVRSGALRVLAVTAPRRLPDLPDLPSIREYLPQYDNASAWQGIFVRTGTPAAVVERINKAVGEVLRFPETATRLNSLGFAPTPSTPEQFADLVKQDGATWAQVIKAAGIKLE